MQPATPASPSPSLLDQRLRRAHRVLAVSFAGTVLSLLGLGVQSWQVREAQTTLMAAREAVASAQTRADELQTRADDLQQTLNIEHKRTRELEQALKEIEPFVPPTNDKLFTILSKGIGQTEEVLLTSTADVAPKAAFADLTSAERSDAYTQEIMIQNTDSAKNLCVKVISWSAGGGGTGDLKCAAAAASLTCSGATTDGWRISPGQTLQKRYDGTALVCVAGSAAGTNFQDLRVAR